MVVGKKYVLVKHFEGEPKESDLSLVEFEVPAVKDGEILAEAEYLSVDPYMRPYTARYPVGITMIGSQVARITESKNPNWPVGKRIVANVGWVSHTVLNPDVASADPAAVVRTQLLPDLNDLPDGTTIHF